MITLEKAKIVLDRFAGGKLARGKHNPPNGQCKVCVEELRCLMQHVTWDGDEPILGEIAVWDWTDRPEGGTVIEGVCHLLNDSNWSSDDARTAGCLRLVTLSEKDETPGWVEKYGKLVIRHIVSGALTDAAAAHFDPRYREELQNAAAMCRTKGTVDACDQARIVAVDAARFVDDCGRQSDLRARNVAYNAAYSAAAISGSAAASRTAAGHVLVVRRAAAERDRILRLGVELLMAAHQGREPNLWALGLSEFAYHAKGAA